MSRGVKDLRATLLSSRSLNPSSSSATASAAGTAATTAAPAERPSSALKEKVDSSGKKMYSYNEDEFPVDPDELSEHKAMLTTRASLSHSTQSSPSTVTALNHHSRSKLNPSSVNSMLSTVSNTSIPFASTGSMSTSTQSIRMAGESDKSKLAKLTALSQRDKDQIAFLTVKLAEARRTIDDLTLAAHNSAAAAAAAALLDVPYSGPTAEELEEAAQHLERVEKRLAEKIAHNDALIVASDDLRLRVSEQSQRIEQLTHSTFELAQAKEAKERQVQELQGQVKSLNEKAESAEKKVEEFIADVERNQLSEKKVLKERLKDAEKERTAMQAQFALKENQSMEEVDQIKAELERLKKENETLRTQFDSSQSQLTTSQNERSLLFTQSSEEILQLKAQIRRLQVEHAELRTEYDQSKQDSQELLTKSVAEANEKLQTQHEQSLRLEQNAKEVTMKLKHQEQMDRKTRKHYEAKLAQAAAERGEVERTMALFKQQLETQMETVKSNMAQNEQDASKKDEEKQQAYQVQLQSLRESYEHQLKDLSSKLGAMSAELSSTTAQKDDAENQCQRAEKRCELVAKQNAELEEQGWRKEKQLKSVVDFVAGVREQLGQLQEFEVNLHPSFTCLRCCKLFESPVLVTTCGHVTCKSCLTVMQADGKDIVQCAECIDARKNNKGSSAAAAVAKLEPENIIQLSQLETIQGKFLFLKPLLQSLQKELDKSEVLVKSVKA